MKLSAAAVLTFSSLALSAAHAAVYRPQKISYDALVYDEVFADSSARALLVDALTQVGMVSVTDIPSAVHKNDALTTVHACAMESKVTKEHTFPDGTLRRTMATHTVPGGIQKMDHQAPAACHAFAQASQPFRETVADVTQAFAMRLTSILDINDKPLLTTKQGEFAFPTVAEVVENGEHLEHFHSYQAASTTTQNDKETIELHTDQGLFLVFTPGLMVHQDDSKTNTLTGGFYIQEQDTTRVEVEFDDKDDLVIMLGDGVNQYVNSKLHDMTLRATPHAFIMPQQHFEDVARVWYGRMVLPPADAVHPQYHDKTFGELRQTMIDASLSKNQDKDDTLSLGCSSDMVARQLEQTTCEGDTMFCWHRCMNTTELGVSDEICAEQGLSMMCMNPRGQIWGDKHGDYFPGCISPDAEVATPYPTLPTYPRDDEACTDQMFEDFASSTGYENTFDLGNGAIFMWSIVDGQVDGRLAFNGLFGWLAFGFANVDGPKNGMHGSTIIMALPGGNYSAVTGLDLDMDPTVAEYVIDPNPAKSAFRHWQDPVTSTSRSGVDSYQATATDCFVELTFKTASIHDKTFNLNGKDELIWGANAVDYYAGYHGESRGRFAIDWPTAMVMLDGAGDGQEETSAAVSASSSSMVLLVAMIMGVAMLHV